MGGVRPVSILSTLNLSLSLSLSSNQLVLSTARVTSVCSLPPFALSWLSEISACNRSSGLTTMASSGKCRVCEKAVGSRSVLLLLSLLWSVFLVLSS